MSIKSSIQMMSNTTSKYTVIGDKIRADSWWGYTDGIHTVSVKYTNFVGSFGIEATLSTDPTDADWFPIFINGSSTTEPNVEFTGETGVRAFTFIGNFVYLRARLIRPDVFPPPDLWAIEQMGIIDNVLLSM